MNRGRAFQGPIPVGDGFMVEEEEARSLLARSDADYSSVVRRYLVGADIAHDPHQEPTRWIIDFASMALEDAMQYPAALAIVRERVKPERDQNRDRGFREQWWRFGRPRREMRDALTGRRRFLAGTATGKRPLFTWCDPGWLPSNLTNVFAFDDDFTFGLLSSAAHSAWAWARCSTLEQRLRYTPTTAFETFPFPYPIGDEQRNEVAGAGREVLRLRREHCAADEIGLTPLYNRLDDGAYSDLRRGHRALDEAVVASYGWPRSIAQDHDELVSRLLERNRQIASGERQYDPFPPAALPNSQQSLL